jgi:hypothetical protein
VDAAFDAVEPAAATSPTVGAKHWTDVVADPAQYERVAAVAEAQQRPQ